MTAPSSRNAHLRDRLRAREQHNVTFFAEDFPIFWKSAHGALVTDVDDNEYVDCTAAFGVANVGHGNERVAHAVAAQAGRLMHGLGDVHPTEVRVRLLERLATILPSALTTTFLATTGSEAIEAALKTAMLATGRRGIALQRVEDPVSGGTDPTHGVGLAGQGVPRAESGEPANDRFDVRAVDFT